MISIPQKIPKPVAARLAYRLVAEESNCYVGNPDSNK